jgi:hypothetical protein
MINAPIGLRDHGLWIVLLKVSKSIQKPLTKDQLVVYFEVLHAATCKKIVMNPHKNYL